MVLDLSDTADFRVFTLASPYRVVVDLPSFSWNVGAIEKPKNNIVREVRTGLLQPGISRLVIDLEKPAAVHNAFLLPASGGKPNRLVVDFVQVPVSDFQKQKDKIYGTLKTPPPGFNLQTADPSLRTANAASGQIIAPARKPAPKDQGPKPVIIIDAGHGGQDPGAIGHGKIYEKNVTLATAKELKQQLENTGRYRVHLTRTTNTYIKLYRRVQIAREHKGDLFISIHADSIDNPKVRGASIYTLSNTASDKQTEKLAAKENKADLIGGVDLSHEDKDVADILIDLTMRDTMNQSKFFANTLVRKMEARGLKLLEKPHRYAGFAVLKAPDIPSVLIETGFMSNKKEARDLATPAYRKKVAAALVDGVNAYFEKVQKNNRS